MLLSPLRSAPLGQMLQRKPTSPVVRNCQAVGVGSGTEDWHGSRESYCKNVFISHSTKDRWIARQMAALIEGKRKAYGVTTFLDEKDVAIGESIPDSIRRNLRECDEFLVLLSRYSVDRSWVLIEIGAAWALDKPINAVVTHLDVVSEIPVDLTKARLIEMDYFEAHPEAVGLVVEDHEELAISRR